MTPEEADEFVSNHEHITVVERELNPEETAKGRAQFLITIDSIDNEPEVQADVENKGLHYFRESSPSQFRHIALPPESK